MCGIFGFIGRSPGKAMLELSINSLRHRGSSGCGYYWKDGSGHWSHRLFNQRSLQLPHWDAGASGVFLCHWRYATSGSDRSGGLQPLHSPVGNTALVHNGQFLVGTHEKASDTEHFFAETLRAEVSDGKSLISLLKRYGGAYSLAFHTGRETILARDPNGIRPLFIGAFDGGLAFSSETASLELLECRVVSELPPGHTCSIEPTLRMQVLPIAQGRPALCSFEHVYFHSREGRLGGKRVSEWRVRLGESLAIEHPIENVSVSAVPNSGCDAALGFASRLGIPIVGAVRRNPGADRTFISEKKSREQRLRGKFSINAHEVRGKSICLVDDSVVRGNTLRFLSAALRSAGASSVHARIAAPRFRFPCHFGIDVPNKRELVVNQVSAENLSAELGLDSIRFLSVTSLHVALNFNPICTGCFTSRYPVPVRSDQPIQREEHCLDA